MPFKTRLCSNKQDFWLLLAHSSNFFRIFSSFFVDYPIFHPFTMPDRPLPRSQRKNRKYTYLSKFWLLTPHSRAPDKIFIWNDNNIILPEFYLFQSELPILILEPLKIWWFSSYIDVFWGWGRVYCEKSVKKGWQE